jgi:hypothetical protein
MSDEWLKIPVVVQQVVAVRDASGGNNRINGFANRDPETAERSKVSCRLNRNILAAQFHHQKRLLAKHLIEFVGLRHGRTLKYSIQTLESTRINDLSSSRSNRPASPAYPAADGSPAVFSAAGNFARQAQRHRARSSSRRELYATLVDRPMD